VQSSSKLIQKAIDQMATLPGIGRKTAMRLVLDLLRRGEDDVQRFAKAFIEMREGIHYCVDCFNLSDTERCHVCSNPNRQDDVLCVVEDIRDIMAIESTQQFNGKYHVLGGKISPMDGIGPQDLKISTLIEKAKSGVIKELIFALSATMEGDTTNFYIYKQLEGIKIKTSTIARGIGVNDELEYADEVTLGRSIINRIPFENALKSS